MRTFFLRIQVFHSWPLSATSFVLSRLCVARQVCQASGLSFLRLDFKTEFNSFYVIPATCGGTATALLGKHGHETCNTGH